MKTITKKINIYNIDQLSKEAQEKAREKFNENADDPFLQANLREYIHEELTEAGYTHDEITPLYSLSYCQGDGLMFEGSVSDKKGNTYTIKHAGHYYHENSKEITGTDKDGNEIETEKFNEKVYIPICKKIEQRGYDEIEYMTSMEAFKETCEANEYTFLKDGTMSNE